HGPSIALTGSTHSIIENLSILSNNGQLNYYGLQVNMSYDNSPSTIVPGSGFYNADGSNAWAFSSFVAPLTQVFIPQAIGIGVGIDVAAFSDNSIVRNVMITNVFTDAIEAESCINCWAYDIVVNWTANLQTYTQWQIEWSKDTGGGC